MVDAGLGQIMIVSGRTKRAIDDTSTPIVLQAELSRRNDRELMAQFAFEHLDAHYFYVRQSEPRGLGHAVLLAEEFVAGEPSPWPWRFVVWNGGGKPDAPARADPWDRRGATIAVEEVTAQTWSTTASSSRWTAWAMPSISTW